MGMKLTSQVEAAIDRARQEGRVVEHAKQLAPEDVDEKDFLAAVIAHAKRLGWKAYHVHYSQKSEAGFPDLVLVRERVVWAELKAENGTTTAAQDEWLDRLREAKQECYLWKPSDWQEILKVLS